jgi:O-antigen ligase
MAAGIPRQRLVLAGGAALLGALAAATVAASPLLGLALVALVLGAVVIVTRPDLVLLTMVAALPWENKLGYPSPTLSLIKIIGAVVFLAYVIKMTRNSHERIYLPPLVGVVVLLFLWIGLSMVVSPDPAACVSKMLRYTLFMSFFFLVIQLVEGRTGVERVLRWFTLSVTAASLYAVYVFIAIGGGRAAGPVQDPNDFAYLLATTLPICGYLIASDSRRRLLWSACFLFICAATLATFSRGALVGVGVLVAWGVVTRRIPVWALLTGLATAGVVVIFAFTVWKPLINESLQAKENIANANTTSRKAFWSAAIQLTEQRPLVGVGPDRYPLVAPSLIKNSPIHLAKPVTHNSYLEIMSEDGIPALFLFLLYLLLSWRELRKVERRARDGGDLDTARLATAFQASMIVAVVSATFLSEQLTSPLWLIPALGLVLSRQYAAEPALPPPLEAEPVGRPLLPPAPALGGGRLAPS